MLKNLSTAAFLISVFVIGAAAQQTVTIGDTNHNNQTNLNLGDTLVVKLSNNAGTGYQWYLEDNNDSLLQLDNNRTKDKSGGLLGGNNQQIFYFNAVGAGGEQLSFAKRRIAGNTSNTADYFRTLVTINRGNQSKTVTVTDDDDRGSVTLRQGDTLVVKLKNNAGTAYNWSVAQNNPDLLRPTGRQGVAAKLTRLLGGATYQTFTFSTPNSGGEMLKFLLQNPNLGGGVRAADWFEIMVTIERP